MNSTVEPETTTFGTDGGGGDGERGISPWLDRPWVTAAFISILPIAVLLILRTTPYFRLNNGDPFIYTGYANDFRNHVERFGYTYHSVRFGLIFPLKISMAFGPFWGYFILRYGLYIATTGSIYFALKPLGRRIGILGAILFVANPVSAEAIMTTHPDTIVVPFFTISFSLAVIAIRHRGWRLAAYAAGAGLCSGLALNANIFYGPLLLLTALLPCAVLLRDRRVGDSVRFVAAYGVSAAAVCIVGMWVYYDMFGEWNIYETTFRAVNDISGDEMWESPYLGWLTTRRFIYAPLFAVAFGGLCIYRSWRAKAEICSEQLVILGLVALALVYYLVYQFVLGGSSLELSYYFSYMIGPVCVLVAASAAWSSSARRMPLWLIATVPIALAYGSQLLEVANFAVFLAVIMMLVTVVVIRPAMHTALLVFAAMSIAWASSPRDIRYPANVGFQYEPHYEDAFGDVNDDGFEAYMLASKLPSFVPADPNRIVPLLFWYRSFDAMLDSIQASYHWETSTVQRIPAAGMPEITPDDLIRLRSLVGGFVVMVARTETEIDAGVATLRNAGFDIAPSAAPQRMQEGDSTIFVLAVGIIGAPPLR